MKQFVYNVIDYILYAMTSRNPEVFYKFWISYIVIVGILIVVAVDGFFLDFAIAKWMWQQVLDDYAWYRAHPESW